MNTANNRRGLLYREKLRQGLLCLLDEGIEIDRITVKAVCEAAGVNRSTFYAHYSVPGDILTEIEDNLLADISEYLRNMARAELDYLGVFLEYIKAHDRVFRILFLHARDRAFLETLIRESLSCFDHVKECFQDRNDYAYVKAFIISGSRDVINTWILRNYAEDTEYIKQLILTANEATIRAFA